MPNCDSTVTQPTIPGFRGEGEDPMIKDMTAQTPPVPSGRRDAGADTDCSVCFSGHREIPEREKNALAARLDAALLRLIEGGYSHFYAGGAIGFDTMAAEAVLALRAQHPHIRLHLVLPCRGQENRWSADNRRTYKRIRDAADEVLYTSPVGYTPGCMQQRDRCLVERCCVCLCYLTRPAGGTAYTVAYARRRGLSVLNLAPGVAEDLARYGAAEENADESGSAGEDFGKSTDANAASTDRNSPEGADDSSADTAGSGSAPDVTSRTVSDAGKNTTARRDGEQLTLF